MLPWAHLAGRLLCETPANIARRSRFGRLDINNKIAISPFSPGIRISVVGVQSMAATEHSRQRRKRQRLATRQPILARRAQPSRLQSTARTVLPRSIKG